MSQLLVHYNYLKKQKKQQWWIIFIMETFNTHVAHKILLLKREIKLIKTNCGILDWCLG